MSKRDRYLQKDLVIFGDPRKSQSLQIGLAVLQMFSADRPVMGIADIADALKICRSTTHRYVITLQACCFLEQGTDRKYRLAPRALNPGMSVLGATGLSRVSTPLLRALCDLVGHTVSLAVLDGDSIIYAARVYSHRRGQYTADTAGASAPGYRQARPLPASSWWPDCQTSRGANGPARPSSGRPARTRSQTRDCLP
jgi:DNA-binding IclR family transcriptional regulator